MIVYSGAWHGPGYLALHPDVVRVSMDPWDHYRRHGHLERRLLSVLTSEGEVVSGAWSNDGYLYLHRDVAEAGMDAWDHFVRYGWDEKRQIAVLAE
jgi:hypothetical protein